MQLSSDTNLRVIFWFLDLYNCRVASSSTITTCVIESWYGKHIYINNNLQFSHCITSNNRTSFYSLNWPKKIVLVSIYMHFIILSRSNGYIYYFLPLDKFINDVTIFSVFCSLIYEIIIVKNTIKILGAGSFNIIDITKFPQGLVPKERKQGRLTLYITLKVINYRLLFEGCGYWSWNKVCKYRLTKPYKIFIIHRMELV